MTLTKPQILNALELNLGLGILRKELKAKLGPKTTAKDCKKALELLDESYTQDELLKFAQEKLTTSKHHTYTYELADCGDIDQASIQQSFAKGTFRNTFSTDTFKSVIINAAKCEIFGTIETTTKAQLFNEATFAYSGQAQTITSHVFFNCSFFLPKHLKIKIVKFSPKLITALDGSILTVLKNDFDDKAVADHLAMEVIATGMETVFVQTNLTTAIKNLVRQERIACIYASAQLSDGSGKEERTNNNTNQGMFVPRNWHDTYLLQSTKIGKTKWFWLDPNPASRSTKLGDYEYHSVDTELGLISQDLFSNESNEVLENEILQNNA